MFFCLFTIGLLISIIASFVLPDRFFNDTKIIVFDPYNESGWIGSYPFTIMFYKITFLKYLPFFLIALFQYPIVIYTLFKIGIPLKFDLLYVKNIITYTAFILIAIFFCMPSKEFINFLFISFIVKLLSENTFSIKKKFILLTISFIIFGFFFRPYFYFIPIIASGMFFIKSINFKNKTITTIFYGILIAVFLSLSHGLVKGKYLSESTRDNLNAERTKDANSMILPPLKTDTWYGETTGIIYGFFAVNLPFEGLKHFLSPQIMLFILWQFILFYILLVRLSRCVNNSSKDNAELWGLLILFSYFIIQGIFEPDLGSAIRHKMGVFPLIYFILYYYDFRKKLPENI